VLDGDDIRRVAVYEERCGVRTATFNATWPLVLLQLHDDRLALRLTWRIPLITALLEGGTTGDREVYFRDIERVEVKKAGPLGIFGTTIRIRHHRFMFIDGKRSP
jgi:hypothetical protein